LFSGEFFIPEILTESSNCMTIETLVRRTDLDGDEKVRMRYDQLEKLLKELRARNLPENSITFINSHISSLNGIAESGNALRRAIREKQNRIIAYLAKELKVVPKNYYRNLWMATGMAAFGLPLGAGLGISLGNMGLIGIGLPLGLAIGMAFGNGLDQKAAQEGKQLAFEVKH
jgi:hypothetical protein